MPSVQSQLLSVFALVSLLAQPSAAAYGQVIREEDGLSNGERAHGSAGYKRMVVAHAVFALLTFLVVCTLKVNDLAAEKD